MQPRQLATFAAGTLAGVALIVACGALPVVGADDSDEQAPLTITVSESACDKENRVIQGSATITSYYAEIELPGLRENAAPFVSAVRCGKHCFGGGGGENECEQLGCEPDGTTCSGWRPPTPVCEPVAPIIVDDRIVVPCGQIATGHGPPGEQGTRFDRAIVRVGL